MLPQLFSDRTDLFDQNEWVRVCKQHDAQISVRNVDNPKSLIATNEWDDPGREEITREPTISVYQQSPYMDLKPKDLPKHTVNPKDDIKLLDKDVKLKGTETIYQLRRDPPPSVKPKHVW